MSIQDARDIVNAKSPEDYRAKQRKVLARSRTNERIVEDEMPARIEHNRWLIDCHCGSGVAVHPDWPEARCLDWGCGRVYTHVAIPPNRVAIERELEKRARHQDRNWRPGETADDLRAEREARS